jgi:hypothetical protein
MQPVASHNNLALQMDGLSELDFMERGYVAAKFPL